MILSAQHIKEVAAKLGFSACGMAPAGPIAAERAHELCHWLSKGRHGEMDYLANHIEKKLNPQLLVEGALTVVSLALNYYPGKMGMPKADGAESNLPNAWRLARYAYATDYHEVVKQLLRRLMTELGLIEGEDGRCFVDTAPVDEKYWAERCGLGWRGRNSQLIIPGAGSYFFLGELILTLPVDRYDQPQPNRCGTCRACLDACPTGALLGDGTMDARQCLSYLTIEYRGVLSPEIGRKMSPCFYGCDRCAEACPWNNFARPTLIPTLQPRPEIFRMRPSDWETLTIEQYQLLFRKSAVKRAKYDGLMRNIEAMKGQS